jgi:single-strand DNA-binding protein
MNDNQVSLVGNIVNDPVLKRVSDKAVVTTFRMASTPRRFDPSTSEWRNLDSLYLTVSCWNRLAERVEACLKGGDPVAVSGRLRMRTYEVVEGQKRTVYEIDAQQVSPDLNRVAVELLRTPRRSVESVPDLTGADDAGLAGEVSYDAGPLVPVQVEPAA